MNFVEIVKNLPSIEGLAQVTLNDASGNTVATIENKPGKSGSLAVYAALAQRHQRLDADAAREGLTLFAEHVQDARDHPGKHPNIDRLIQIIENGSSYTIELHKA